MENKKNIDKRELEIEKMIHDAIYKLGEAQKIVNSLMDGDVDAEWILLGRAKSINRFITESMEILKRKLEK